MGNTHCCAGESSLETPQSSGGLLNCCATSTETYASSQMHAPKRVLMYSARSMARDSSDSEDEHPFEINQNFEDSGPLTLVSPRDGGSGTGRSGAFNLREQLRLNTGILCTGNKPGGAFTMSFA